jgi:threonine synthase
MSARRSAPRSWFACSQHCGFTGPLTQAVYRCPKCESLLEVAQDRARLARRSGRAWRRLFEARAAASEPPFNSGVWAKKEWIYPDLPDEEIVTLGEGHMPLLPLPAMAQRLGLGSLTLKQCGVSPTGSFKDLGMTVLVSAVQRMRGLGRGVRAIVCASTGDTSAALAAYGAAARIPTVVLLPKDKVSLTQLVQPLANGALVLALETDFDGCMALVRELTRDGRLYLANSMNPLRIEGQKIVAVDLCQQLSWRVPDWVVVPGGNLGNASALGSGFALMAELGVVAKRPRIAVAQAARANPLARAFRKGFRDVSPITARPTLASAIQIGNPVSMERAVKVLQRFRGAVADATEQELADAAAEADREGAFACPQTGVALAAVRKLVRRGDIARRSHVVVIATAHGLKFPDFKLRYHERTLGGVTPRWANGPVVLPAESGAIERVLRRYLDRGRSFV